jgi:pyruvate/2-oxoglutarate dehydrogenase complex dihydrolipoamide dehydrogenase (E3) component
VDRGYTVEVLEKEGCIGGQIQSASRPPHKKGFMDWVDWAVRELGKKDVAVRCNTQATKASLKEHKPDAVILASGAYPVAAPIPGIDGSNVFDARDVLVGKITPKGTAVILGAGYVGMETADYLAERGIDAVILEMQPIPPVGKHTAHGYWLHKRLRQAGARLYFGAKVLGIKDGSVLYAQGDEEKIQEAAMVITAMGAKPENALEPVLKDLGIPYRAVGDAISPRRLLEAIHEGHRAGYEI